MSSTGHLVDPLEHAGNPTPPESEALQVALFCRSGDGCELENQPRQGRTWPLLWFPTSTERNSQSPIPYETIKPASKRKPPHGIEKDGGKLKR